MLEVALAIVEQEGKWLLQLRDDLDWIVAPGCWGLFGGHLEPGETPEEALRRELLEEIRWEAGPLSYWFADQTPQRLAHFFLASLGEPLERLRLQEGQDFLLADLDDLRHGMVWSPVVQEFRPLAASLQLAVKRFTLERGGNR
jgi:8-oxo-dGTP pyrophosphatase MutT (NUDIX family)